MLTSRWSMAVVASLAFGSGCSGSSQEKLYPVVSARGFLTYSLVDPALTASMATNVSDSLPGQPRGYDPGTWRRQRDEQAYQDRIEMNRLRQEQWRREQQEQQASQDARRTIVQEQTTRERQREQMHYERQRLWTEQIAQRSQVESMRLQQASYELDNSLLRLQQQQLDQAMLRQR